MSGNAFPAAILIGSYHLKVFNIVLILLLSLSIFAKQNKHKEVAVELHGADMLDHLAHTCSEANWSKLSTWAKSHNIEERTYSVKVPKVLNGQFIYKSEKVIIAAKSSGYQLSLEGQIFTGNDTCEVINKIPEDLKSTHWFLNKFFPVANAKPLITNEPRAKEMALLAFTGITLVN